MFENLIYKENVKLNLLYFYFYHLSLFRIIANFPLLLTSLIYIAFISTFAAFDNFKCRTR